MTTPDHVLAAKLSGDITVEDVHALYAALDPKLKAHKAIGMVLDIDGFNDASREAIDADVKRELSLLGNLPQFQRAAFVTSKKWLAYLVERVDPIIPSMNMKVFAPGEEKAAIDWASEV